VQKIAAAAGADCVNLKRIHRQLHGMPVLKRRYRLPKP
jgi:hypothetical protein